MDDSTNIPQTESLPKEGTVAEFNMKDWSTIQNEDLLFPWRTHPSRNCLFFYTSPWSKSAFHPGVGQLKGVINCLSLNAWSPSWTRGSPLGRVRSQLTATLFLICGNICKNTTSKYRSDGDFCVEKRKKIWTTVKLTVDSCTTSVLRTMWRLPFFAIMRPAAEMSP